VNIPRPKHLIRFDMYDGEHYCGMSWLGKHILDDDIINSFIYRIEDKDSPSPYVGNMTRHQIVRDAICTKITWLPTKKVKEILNRLIDKNDWYIDEDKRIMSFCQNVTELGFNVIEEKYNE